MGLLPVYDSMELFVQGSDALETHFLYSEFKALHPDWFDDCERKICQPISEEKIYHNSHKIFRNFLMEYSNVKITKMLQYFFQTYHSISSLFCVHSRFPSSAYYFSHFLAASIRILKFVKKQHREKSTPSVFIVTSSERSFSNTKYPDLTVANIKRLKLLDGDIYYGGADRYSSELKELLKNRDQFSKIETGLKYIIFEDMHIFHDDKNYQQNVIEIINLFIRSNIQFIFFSNGLSTSAPPAFHTIKNMLEHPLVLAIEDYVPNTYESVNICHILSQKDFLIAYEYCNNQHKRGKCITPFLLKIERCHYEVEKLLKSLKCTKELALNDFDNIITFGKSLNNGRLLIVCSNEKTANTLAVALSLKIADIRVGLLTENDDRDSSEELNFKMKHKDYNVVVCDFNSIVDISCPINSVIFFDVPEVKYFQYYVEVAVRKLVRKYSLKLLILFDEDRDIATYDKCLKLVRNYSGTISETFLNIKNKNDNVEF